MMSHAKVMHKELFAQLQAIVEKEKNENQEQAQAEQKPEQE